MSSPARFFIYTSRMLRLFAALLLLLAAARPVDGQSLADLGADEVSVAPSTLSKAGAPVWTSDSFAREATGFIVSGRSSDSDMTAWGRFGDGDWRELTVVRSATSETFYAGFSGDVVYGGGSFDVRFETDADVTIEASGVFDNRMDSDRGAETTPSEDRRSERGGDTHHLDRGRSSKAAAAIIPPRMYTRDEWDAEPFKGNPVPLARPNYLYMAFHHAAGFWAHSLEEGLDQVKAIQMLHQDVRGWSDIGYHFVVDMEGRLYQGRPFLNGEAPLASVPALAMGAHVGGTNTGNVGICVLGCYHPPAGSNCENVMSEAAVDSLAVMYAFISEKYGIPPDHIMGHRQFETASTACPGDNNMAIIDDLRERVRTYLITGNTPLGAAELAATIDEDGVVHLSWEFLEDRGIASYRVVRVQGDESTVIYEGDGAGAASVADGGAAALEEVTYRLYAASEDGREQLLAAVDVELGDVQQYVLTENYPDPFSRSTTIRYYLPQDGIVHLAVFDLLGREIEVVDAGSRNGGRWYDVDFDAAGLPAGTYYYRLTVEGFSGTVYNEARSLVRVR